MLEPKTNSIWNVAGAEALHKVGTLNATGTDGVAFRALLERLERDAHALEHDVARVEGPKALAGAVDKAHASLQDVLSLGDQLLEAYREALAQQKSSSEPHR